MATLASVSKPTSYYSEKQPGTREGNCVGLQCLAGNVDLGHPKIMFRVTTLCHLKTSPNYTIWALDIENLTFSLSICWLCDANMRKDTRFSLTLRHARESLNDNCIITRPKHKHSSPTCVYSPLPCTRNKHAVFYVNCRPKWKWKVECDWLHAVCVWLPSKKNSIKEDIRFDPQFWAPPRPWKLHRQRPLSEDNWPGKNDMGKTQQTDKILYRTWKLMC